MSLYFGCGILHDREIEGWNAQHLLEESWMSYSPRVPDRGYVLLDRLFGTRVLQDISHAAKKVSELE